MGAFLIPIVIVIDDNCNKDALPPRFLSEAANFEVEILFQVGFRARVCFPKFLSEFQR